MESWRKAEAELAELRLFFAAKVRESSYREVARLTGFSTNTLQRWVREAKP